MRYFAVISDLCSRRIVGWPSPTTSTSPKLHNFCRGQDKNCLGRLLMKAKAELLLYRLLWLAKKPLQPTYFNLGQSFEGWAYRNGLLNQIHQLEGQGFLEAV